MRKHFIVFCVLVLLTLALLSGCSKAPDKKVVSRPVQSQPADTTAVVEQSVETAASDEPAAVATSDPETKSVVPTGSADCEQLASADVGAVFGGSWTKLADCPQRPTMPKGVSVCRCDYDGPKQVYVNVETQLYSDTAESLKVFDMYCKGATAVNLTSKSCSMLKTSTTRPNYVYFLKNNYFVKVSCLGGSCPIAGLTMLAQKVEEKI